MEQLTQFESILPEGLRTKLVELTSSLSITTHVPTTIAQPYATITSVLQSVSERQASAASALFVVKESLSSISLINDILQAQATMNFYQALEKAATETNTASQASLITQAAEASEIMLRMFNEDAYYSGNYPSLGGNTALLVVYSIMLAVQVASGVFYHQWWFLTCWTLGLLAEVIGYAGRIWSSQNIKSFNAFVMQLVCLTLAPCFMMAGIYYVIAQLTEIYGNQYSSLKPMQYSLIFILCDLISIALQAAGGGVAAGSLSEYESSDSGSHIMVGGLAFQVFTIAVFQYFWYLFLYRVYKAWKISGDSAFNPNFKHIRERNLLVPFIGVVSFAVILIFVRSIYRLIELAEGWSSPPATKEIYFMILEALMVSLASCVVTVISPGYAYGRQSHIYIDKNPKNTFAVFKKGSSSTDEDIEKQTHNDEDDYFSSDNESRNFHDASRPDDIPQEDHSPYQEENASQLTS